MKRNMLFVLMALLAIAAFAGGKNEAPTLRVLHSGDTLFDGVSHIDEVIKLFNARYPDIKVEHSKLDLSDGSALTMDAMIAAGAAPNVYSDTMVRASKYMRPGFALPLDGLVSDLDKYTDLGPYRKNGELLALPQAGGAQAMAINLDIMDDIGYTVPNNWTIADFLQMAELVKQRYGGKRWATGMFAANQSGDYLINQWFASFGVSFYAPGGYDVSTIAKTGGAKVYDFFKLLDKSGYIPPNSASLNDDDYAAAWGDGLLAATAFFPSWMKPYWDTAIKQGTIQAPFRVKYVPFPRSPGVSKVPVYFSNAAVLVVKTGTEIDKAAAYFAEVWNGQWAQTHILKTGTMSTRSDVKPNQDVYLLQVADIVAKHGIQDVGLTDSRFTERRAQQFPILQRLLTGKISPADAIETYQHALTSVK
jgi:ABC-type glycerol-3-phosphate transport system substrate-binding protein